MLHENMLTFKYFNCYYIKSFLIVQSDNRMYVYLTTYSNSYNHILIIIININIILNKYNFIKNKKLICHFYSNT